MLAVPAVAGPESELIEHFLAVARNRLGMELSWVSSLDGDSQVVDHVAGDLDAFSIRPGDSVPLDGSCFQRVADGRLPGIVADMTCHPITADVETTEALGLGSYVGAPIEIAGEVTGMLCCASRGPSHHLGDEQTQALGIIAQLVGEILTKESPKQRRDRAVAERISSAIESGALESVFQPIVEIETGEVIGVEALTRFAGPPARPDVWFEEAASVGMGVELEIAALRLALEQLADLPHPQFMALNASPSTIRDPRLVEVLSEFDPARCVIEVTEHAGVDDYEELGRSLQSLRDLGVRIAVDDVGAGFASLANVLELQPTVLKIDRSIVKGIHSDTARQALAQTIMRLAERLGATVVAEGIEVSLELDALAALGVHHAQGFLYGHPQSALPDAPHVAVSATRAMELPLSALTVDQELAARRFELAMLHSPVGMALVSVNGSFIHVNPSLASMLGRRTRDFDELAYPDITHPDDRENDGQFLSECLGGDLDDYRMEKRFLTLDGSTMWGDVSVVLVRATDNRPMYFIVQVQDISDRHRREHALTARATTDHLTAIANRSAASEYLEDLAASSTPFGVLYCDLRNFKTINDTFGHRSGDLVLIAVAQRLKQMTRSGDHVSRWGGDEFLLIVPHATDDFLEALSMRVADGVAKPVSLHPGTDTALPTITIGTARFDPDAADSVDTVLHRADSHMYEQREGRHAARETARNGFQGDPVPDRRAPG